MAVNAPHGAHRRQRLNASAVVAGFQVSTGGRIWVSTEVGEAFPTHGLTHTEHATISIWKTVTPPPGLLLDGDEGESEIDVVIETPSIVWFIEAKLTSDISVKTTMRSERDQVLRNIDVGSFYAGTRRFYFSLLIANETRSKEGVGRVKEYQDLAKPRELLAKHRPDGLVNLSGVSQISWGMVADVLRDAAENAPREDERQYAARARNWMAARALSSDHSQSHHNNRSRFVSETMISGSIEELSAAMWERERALLESVAGREHLATPPRKAKRKRS